MNEGWLDDDYLILFSEETVASASAKYGIDRVLPGYDVVGLRSWDDLLVRDPQGAWFSIPCVPMDVQYLKPFNLAVGKPLQYDRRFVGKIKWYVAPLVFGGKAQDSQNVSWISHEQHPELVAWWNAKYREVKGAQNV